MPPESDSLTVTIRDNKANTATVTTPGSLIPTYGSSGRPPTLYFGEDATGHELTVEIEYAGSSGSAKDLVLTLTPGTHLIDANAWKAESIMIQCPQGWTAASVVDAFTFAPMLVLNCKAAHVVAGKPHRARFKLENLRSDKGSWTAGALTVTPANFPGISAPAGLDLPVHTAGLPAGPLVVAWAAPSTGEITITRDLTRPVHNTLRLTLTNDNATRPLIDLEGGPLEPAPVVHFEFQYAESFPGYGALCTVAHIARNPPTVRLEEGSSPGYGVIKAGPEDSPHWSLPLSVGNGSLLMEGKSVVVVFEEVLSDLGLDAAGLPDTTGLTVRWEHIPGLPDGEHVLPISKEGRCLIYGLSSDLQPGLQIYYDQDVELSWYTKGAGRSFLIGGPAEQKHVNDGGGEKNTQIVKPRPGRNVFQVLAYEKADAEPRVTPPSATSEPIVFAFADPIIQSFTGTFVVVDGNLSLDLTWFVINADSCYLSSYTGKEAVELLESRRVNKPYDDLMYTIYRVDAVGGAQRVHKDFFLPQRPKVGDRLFTGLVYRINADGLSGMVVTDSDLTQPDPRWQSNSGDPVRLSPLFTYSEADMACQNLNRDGFSDWLLLSKSELDEVWKRTPLEDEKHWHWISDIQERNGHLSATKNGYGVAIDTTVMFRVRAFRAFSVDDLAKWLNTQLPQMEGG